MTNNALVPIGSTQNLSNGVPSVGRISKSFFLKAVKSINDRFGFIQSLWVQIEDPDGNLKPFKISSQTPVSEVCSLLGLPRSLEGNLLYRSSIYLEGRGSMEDGQYAFIVPIGGAPFSGEPPACPHCSKGTGDFREPTYLEVANNRLRCPNPFCTERKIKRLQYFAQRMIGFLSPTMLDDLTNRGKSTGIDTLLNDEFLLVNEVLNVADKQNYGQLIRSLVDVFFGEYTTAQQYEALVTNFFMSLSVPGLTQQMISDAISVSMFENNPPSVFQRVIENLDVGSRRDGSRYPSTLKSFLQGALPKREEMEFYIVELQRIYEILLTARGKI